MEIQKRLKKQKQKQNESNNKKKSSSDLNSSVTSGASSANKPMDRRKALDASKQGSKKSSALDELKAKRAEKLKAGN